MKNYLLNITWKCQLSCSYCWVRKSINTNPVLDGVTQRPFEDWKNAIERDPADYITLAGGEPLSVPWAIDLMRAFPGIKWCLSTNGIVRKKINELAAQRLPQIFNINLSYHPETAAKYDWYTNQWKAEMLMLAAAGYNVSSNVENINDNVEKSGEAIEWAKAHGLPMLISPICGGRDELSRPQGIGLVCEGGINHLVIDPAGNAWTCQSSINSYAWDKTCLGNWLDGPLDIKHKPNPCYLYCVEYFVQYKEHQAGDFFFLNVREAK